MKPRCGLRISAMRSEAIGPSRRIWAW